MSPIVLSTVAIWASTRPSRARSSSARARTSASPNRTRRRHALPVRAQEIHRQAEIEGQPPGVAMLGQVREGLEGLLEGGHRLAERGALVRPGAGPLAVGHGLVPHLAPQGMVGEPFDLLSSPVGRECLKHLYQARVQPPPPLQQKAAIGHLVCQSMLEGVLRLGEQAGLIQELCRLQVRQAAVQRRLGTSAMAWSSGKGTWVPTTAAVCRSRFSSGGRRSMRAASTACTVAGTAGIGMDVARR